MTAFSYNSLVAGAPLVKSAVQTFAVGNGTANYRVPRSGETVSGNLTIAVDAADPDGLARVLVGFQGSSQALVLCNANCGSAFSTTVTGINPRNFGLTPGSLRLELWLEDLPGNRILFDARDIEWLPEPIVGVTTQRQNTTLQLNWSPNPNARRYNVYIAQEPGITPENILGKTGGRQFLALSQSSLAIPNLVALTRYFVLVTGIDSSGESLYAEEHIVQPVGAPQFSLPLAVDDQFELNEDTVLNGVVVANDSHPDGTHFNLDPEPVRSPDNGTLQLNPDGSFIYQPDANFHGEDSFVYQISDARGLTAQAQVNLTVLPVNDLPVVQQDSYSLDKNTRLTIEAPGLLSNDADIDGDSLQVDSSPVTPVSHGSLELSADGSFSYIPVANYAGEDFFVYQVSDGQGGTAQAKVNLRIEMTNAAPIAQNDSYQLNEDSRLQVGTQDGILGNDSDPDGDAFTLVSELLSNVSNGQLILMSDGSFQYIPNQDFFGTDSFSYQIKDPAGLTSSATVMLQVLPQNDPPVVQASSYSVTQDGLLSVAAPGLLEHVLDIDDQTFSVMTTASAAPAKGLLTLAADGAFEYKPDGDFFGTDSFSYQVLDAAGASGTGTVVITVVAKPKPPVLADVALQILDIQAVDAVIAQLVVESSAPGTRLSYRLIDGNSQGIFNLTNEGALRVSDAEALRTLGGSTLTLIAEVEDSNGLSAQATISIRVISTKITVNNDSYTGLEDTVLRAGVSVLSNDLDPSGQGLTAALVTAPVQGSLSFTADGQFEYSPAEHFNGQDQFVYSASNGISTVEGTVTILIEAVNDSPVLQGAGFSLSESLAQGSVIGQLSWQDADVGQSYSFSISGAGTEAFSINSQGQLILANTAALVALNLTQLDLQVQITDSGGASSSAVVSLQIQPAQPIAVADAYSTNNGTLLTVDALSGVLSNDTAASAAGLTAALVSGPASGVLSLAADGSFSYQPNASFSGQDSFVYRASNGVRTADAVVNLTVRRAVVANADAYTLAEDSLLTVTAANSVLQNDSYDAPPAVSVSLINGPASGSLSLNNDGTFSYQPAANAFGVQSFTYRLTQGISSSETQVQLTITPVNDAPLLQSASASITENAANLQNVLTLSVTDVDPGSYSFDIVSGNSAGVFDITSAGVLRIANASLLNASTTPGYNLQVRVTEENNASLTSIATVSISVTAGVAVQANADFYTFNEDTLLTVTSANSVLVNDSYGASPAVSVSLVSGPPTGTLSLNSNGTFTYQPAANAYGTYYFTYRVTQGSQSADAQVELNITPVNDAPVLADATVTIRDDYFDLQQVHTLSVTDLDPGSYSFDIISGDSSGVFSVSADGVIKVANSALLNATTTPSYSLVLKITENNDINLTDTALVVINVTAAVQGDVTEVLNDNAFAGGTGLSLQMMLSGEYNDPVQIVPLSDGRSLVVGTVKSTAVEELFVMRLNVDGTVDSSYADQGLFRNKILSVSQEEQAVAAVLTGSDELVILANYDDGTGTGFFLVRLDSEGELDTTFGGIGYILCAVPQCETDATATDLILDNAGKYVVSGTRVDSPSSVTEAFLYQFTDAGFFNGTSVALGAVNRFDMVRQDSAGNYYGIGQATTGYIAVARFSSAFALDSSTFNCDPSCAGYQTYEFSAAATQAYDASMYDDELYIVGSITQSADPTSPDALFFKVMADSEIDPSFGNTGLVQVNGFSGNPLHYRSIVNDGSDFYILTSTEDMYQDVISLSRYDLAGQFGTDVALSTETNLKAVRLVSYGSHLWLLGQLTDPAYGPVASVSFNWVGKYQSSSLNADTSFSANGQRWFNAGFSSDTLYDIKRLELAGQTDKTLFYGESYSYANGSYQQAFIGRLTASGALDHGFGNHGVVLIADDQISNISITDIIEASGNQLYIAGHGENSTNDQGGFVLRLHQNGSLDITFGGGFVTLDPTDSALTRSYDQSSVIKLNLTASEQVLVAAEYGLSNSNVDVVTLRLNTDGSLDTSFGSSGYAVFSEIDSGAATIERVSKLVQDPDDASIVIAGRHFQASDQQLFVASYTEDGVLRSTANSVANPFAASGNGYSLINLVVSATYSEYVNGLVIDTGGNLVLALSKGFEGDDTHYLSRLDPAGVADTSFNSGLPRSYGSFSDAVPLDLEIKDIFIDDSDRVLMLGRYGAYAWIGRVLMDGTGSQPGRWDPAFEDSSAIAGAYLFDSYSFSDLVMGLSGNKLSLGWSEYDGSTSRYSLRLKRFQLFESPP